MPLNLDPNVIVFKDAKSMSWAAAEMFSKVAEHAIEERNQLLVALSGGSTPVKLFQFLASPPGNIRSLSIVY
jgi:6-phosphogluconolactonase/glucosamine-6-phosphate isomerase/deaminase